MVVRWRSLFVALLAIGLIGCPNNENNGGPSNVQIEPDTGPDEDGDTGNNESDDGGTDAATNNTDPDMGPDMDGVQTPGFMHGEWEVTRAGDDSFIATLELAHEQGETMLRGTYEMQEPAGFGELAGTTWQNDTFTTSWTIDVEGSNERFGLASCTRDGSDDVLACRYTATLTGEMTDALMTRQ